MEINYKQGDLFELLPDGPVCKVVPHVCNDIGGWGSGFVVAISKRWPIEMGVASPEWAYRQWFDGNQNPVQIITSNLLRDGKAGVVDFKLGEIQWVYPDRPFVNGGRQATEQDSPLMIVNMVAQSSTIGANPGSKPIRYEALVSCMGHVRNYCVRRNAELLGKCTNKPAEIHCPKFGSDRAGGTWEFIEELIAELWLAHDIPVTVYEYV